MPWQEQTVMSLRIEFVSLVSQGGISFSEACRRFGVSRPTGYRWWSRYQAEGKAGLANQSSRPHHSPGQTTTAMEQAVITLRDEHPTWGGRKIRAVLGRQGLTGVPSASTITAILRRHDRLGQDSVHARGPWQRFVYAAPNDLWQLDFKGHFPLATGRCHPLTVLDDCSRYVLGLFACANEQDLTVQAHLTSLFRRYGLPWRMLADNGSPWGSTMPNQPLTRLSVWLLRLGIEVRHGRFYHPQTQGKVERVHRTIKADLLQHQRYPSLDAAQSAFTDWRQTYNQLRPHDALDLDVPASHYQSSVRSFPDPLPAVDYGEGELVRTVRTHGEISYRGQRYLISLALRGQPIALRPTLVDGVFDIHFAQYRMGVLNLRTRRFTMQYGVHSKV